MLDQRQNAREPASPDTRTLPLIEVDNVEVQEPETVLLDGLFKAPAPVEPTPTVTATWLSPYSSLIKIGSLDERVSALCNISYTKFPTVGTLATVAQSTCPVSEVRVHPNATIASLNPFAQAFQLASVELSGKAVNVDVATLFAQVSEAGNSELL